MSVFRVTGSLSFKAKANESLSFSVSFHGKATTIADASSEAEARELASVRFYDLLSPPNGAKVRVSIDEVEILKSNRSWVPA